MRTTVTHGPDVERLIRDAMKERYASFKGVLNDAVRTSLRGKAPDGQTEFTQKTFRMGDPKGFRWDKALAISDTIEDEELSRKLAAGRVEMFTPTS